MTFDLPMPPSVNNLFSTIVIKGKSRRIITREYKAWKAQAAAALAPQYAAYGGPAVHRPVHLKIALGMGYRGDIANREKAITDLLVEHVEMPDDRYIERITIERDQSVEGARVTIEGSALPDSFQSFGDLAKSIVARCAGGAE